MAAVGSVWVRCFVYIVIVNLKLHVLFESSCFRCYILHNFLYCLLGGYLMAVYNTEQWY